MSHAGVNQSVGPLAHVGVDRRQLLGVREGGVVLKRRIHVPDWLVTFNQILQAPACLALDESGAEIGAALAGTFHPVLTG